MYHAYTWSMVHTQYTVTNAQMNIRNAYCNQLDYDTLDMANRRIANKESFCPYHLDTNICPWLICTLVQILGIALPKADELCK